MSGQARYRYRSAPRPSLLAAALSGTLALPRRDPVCPRYLAVVIHAHRSGYAMSGLSYPGGWGRSSLRPIKGGRPPERIFMFFRSLAQSFL